MSTINQDALCAAVKAAAAEQQAAVLKLQATLETLFATFIAGGTGSLKNCVNFDSALEHAGDFAGEINAALDADVFLKRALRIADETSAD